MSVNKITGNSFIHEIKFHLHNQITRILMRFYLDFSTMQYIVFVLLNHQRDS